MNLWSANIIFDIGGVLFEQNSTNHVTPLPGLTILEECFARQNSQESRLHKLYVLSNACPEVYELLLEQYPNFINYFDGIILTHYLPHKKPHHTSYRHILDKHDLHPAESIFIDDQYENIVAAEECGMIGVHHVDTQSTLRMLQNLKVL